MFEDHTALFVIGRKADQSMSDPLHGISTVSYDLHPNQHNAEYAKRKYSNRDPSIAAVV